MKDLLKTLVMLPFFIALGLLISRSHQDPCAPAAEHYVKPPVSKTETTSVEFIQNAYETYNNAYFGDKLPKDIEINLDNHDKNEMASTHCSVQPIHCRIKYNIAYVLAPKIAQEVTLHEMCHVKVWILNDDMDDGVHGRLWRGCMVNLDLQGAWRQLLITNYVESMPGYPNDLKY